jgi:uncharacterized protein (DUF433 family)
MTAAIQYPHITIDGSGIARIGDSRFKVLHLAGEHYHCRWSAEEIRRQHPDLRPAEVYAALTYFYDHYDEMVRKLKENAEFAAKMREGQTLSREDLLKRRYSTETG